MTTISTKEYAQRLDNAINHSITYDFNEFKSRDERQSIVQILYCILDEIISYEELDLNDEDNRLKDIKFKQGYLQFCKIQYNELLEKLKSIKE
jgi:hypothetical protein